MLLENGANRKIGCYEGLKPYEVAHKWGHVECREITKYIVPVVRFISVRTFLNSQYHDSDCLFFGVGDRVHN